MAAVYLQKTFGTEFVNLELDFSQKLDRQDWKTLKRMTETNVNCPQASSMGRLFDAVSCLVGLRDSVNYEGQAAIELEAIADSRIQAAYEFEISDDRKTVHAQSVIRGLVADLLDEVPAAEVSAKFHLGVARLIRSVANQIREEHKLNRVALSGGVFQNMFLLKKTCAELTSAGFEVLTHSRVPPNDGGISLGQAVIANAQLLSGRI
jgi:hydrogenase maturation protein HypF